MDLLTVLVRIWIVYVLMFQSLKEYLITRAIDSPQTYVYVYAYGMDVAKNENETILVRNSKMLNKLYFSV